MADVIVCSVLQLLTRAEILRDTKLGGGIVVELCYLYDELKKMRITVLDDAERRRYKERGVKHWLSRLEQACYEMEDLLEEWIYEFHKTKHDRSRHVVVCFTKKKAPFPNADLAKKLRAVKAKLDEILKQKDEYNFNKSRHLPSPQPWRVPPTIRNYITEKVEGREFDKDIIVGKLMANDGVGFRIVSVVGVGGVGKTTLARLVYKDKRLLGFDYRIWVSVSDPDPLNVVKVIIQSIERTPRPHDDIDPLKLSDSVKLLQSLIYEKKILLVLDDVSAEGFDKWGPLETALKHGGSSCRILVTTQSENAAKEMGTRASDMHHLGLLSDDDCWLLMRSRIDLARMDSGKSEDVGRKIASKCNGLPLTALTLGTVLDLADDWEDVLKSEVWGLVKVKDKIIFPHLLMSYNELSPLQKRCFSYCACFKKGAIISVEEVIRKWMAQGYLGSLGDNLELIGKECFKKIARLCLFKDFINDPKTWDIKQFKMHDVVHDFVEFIANDGEKFKTYCRLCNQFSAGYRTLLLNEENPRGLACECLASLRVLGLTRSPRMEGIPWGMEKLIHLKWLSIDFGVLSKEDVMTICKLYHLQTLVLRSCSLRGIPTEIGNLMDLRHLDLSNNKELVELPKSLGDLIELRTVIVDGCISLRQFPLGIKRLMKT